MAIGFAVNLGHSSLCAKDSAAAIEAFGLSFPYVTGSQPVVCNLESSVFTAPDIFTNTISCHDLTTAQIWTFSHPLKLAQCAVDPAVEQAAQLLNATPSQILNVFGFGFGSVVLFWFFGYVIAVSIIAIRKL